MNQQFKEVFDAKYEDIWLFMEEVFDEGKECPWGGKLVSNKDLLNHDSYGNEDSILERVYYFKDYDIFVLFKGTRQSYAGEEWQYMKEVKPVTKTIINYE